MKTYADPDPGGISLCRSMQISPDLKHCFKVGTGAGAGICPESKMSKMGGSDPAKNIQDNFYPLQGNVLFYLFRIYSERGKSNVSLHENCKINSLYQGRKSVE